MKDFLGNEIHVGDKGISTVKHYTELCYVEVVEILPVKLKIRELKNLDCDNRGTERLICPYQFVVMNKNENNK